MSEEPEEPRVLGGDGGVNAPFARVGKDATLDDVGERNDAILAGGLQVLAGTMPVTGGPYDGTIVPILAFRFHAPEGGIYPDVILAVERTELQGLWKLIREAGNASIREADSKNPFRPRGPRRPS